MQGHLATRCRPILGSLAGGSRRYMGAATHIATYRSYGSASQKTGHAGAARTFVPLSDGHAYIAVGSNVGSRIDNIERAQSMLNRAGLPVTRASHLYETAPMYFEDQRRFVNGVFEVRIEKDCSSLDLLRRVKTIEEQLGRHKTFENGPREIDLDILLHGQHTFESQELTVPHKEMLEREFVLRPLSDLIPDTSHPGLPGYSYGRRLARLAGNSGPSSTMPSIASMSHRIAHFAPAVPTRQTQLMAVINVTPDSFSDGGVHLSDPTVVAATCNAMRRAGATIIDIGGQSTRPGAPAVGADEEMARVLPLIQTLRSDRHFDSVALSIDTYHAAVASAAMDAGADMINDISGGLLDAAMLPLAAERGYPIILMHMRGDPSSMNKLTDYSAYEGGVVAGVAAELGARVRAALEAGVRPWRIMLDPGIGFAKTGAQNLELLRRLSDLRNAPGLQGFPWLLGASRKSFLGRITGVKEPERRTWGTAATVVAAIQGGADVVRVHDVLEMAQVKAVADAIYRMRGDKLALPEIT